MNKIDSFARITLKILFESRMPGIPGMPGMPGMPMGVPPGMSQVQAVASVAPTPASQPVAPIASSAPNTAVSSSSKPLFPAAAALQVILIGIMRYKYRLIYKFSHFNTIFGESILSENRLVILIAYKTLSFDYSFKCSLGSYLLCYMI